jgi:radical SAM superfamily enzyme YgiQ (UPF0313 family)
MELPRRAKDDVFLPDGAFGRVTNELRRQQHCHDARIAIAYAFDFRTRVLPFFIADMRMPPAGPRAIAAALTSAGFQHVRIVLQQWNPNFRPSRAQIDGRPLDVLMVSAMQIHSEPAYGLVRDAWSLGEDRPLIIAGGPKAIYEPTHFLGIGPKADVYADVVVTGEEYVLLELLQCIGAHRINGETMREGFDRARREGALDGIPGLAYRDPDSPPDQPTAISTGVQRLLRDLDELPMPHTALRLLEPRHRGTELTGRVLPDRWFASKFRHMLLSIVMTHGCKFACSYCPIPAYNQRTWRTKSPQRMIEEFRDASQTFGIRYFFGTDDNFFNNRQTIVDLFEAFATARIGNKRLRHKVRLGTEATQFDVYKNRDLLPLCRDGGLTGIWFGIEDLHTDMVNKGQSAEKTRVVFSELRRLGIESNVMMIHHDDQPLETPGSLRGLLNQARFLYEHGAVSYQVTYLGSAIGTKLFENAILAGTHTFEVAGKRVPDAYWDGNHVISSGRDDAWKRQLHLLAAYASFYNPVNVCRTFLEYGRDRVGRKRFISQIWGIYGVVRTAIKTARWIWDLRRGPVVRVNRWPAHPVRLVDAQTRQDTVWSVDPSVVAQPSAPAVVPAEAVTLSMHDPATDGRTEPQPQPACS